MAKDDPMNQQTPARTLLITFDDDGIHIDASHTCDLSIALEAAQRMVAVPTGLAPDTATPDRATTTAPVPCPPARPALRPSVDSMRVRQGPVLADDSLGPFPPETAEEARGRRQLAVLDDDWFVDFRRGIEIEIVKDQAAAERDGVNVPSDDDWTDGLSLDLPAPGTAALLHAAHIRSLIGPDDDEEWDEEMEEDDGESDVAEMGDTASFRSGLSGIRMTPPSTRLH